MNEKQKLFVVATALWLLVMFDLRWYFEILSWGLFERNFVFLSFDRLVFVWRERICHFFRSVVWVCVCENDIEMICVGRAVNSLCKCQPMSWFCHFWSSESASETRAGKPERTARAEERRGRTREEERRAKKRRRGARKNKHDETDTLTADHNRARQCNRNSHRGPLRDILEVLFYHFIICVIVKISDAM